MAFVMSPYNFPRIFDKQVEACVAAADAYTKSNQEKYIQHLRKAAEAERAHRLYIESRARELKAAQTPTPEEKNTDPTAQLPPDKAIEKEEI